MTPRAWQRPSSHCDSCGPPNGRPAPPALPQPPRLTLPLEKHENIPLADRPLDVAHDRARGVLDELDTNLRDLTGLAGAAEHLGHLCELDWLILRTGGCGVRPRSGRERGARGEGGTQRTMAEESSRCHVPWPWLPQPPSSPTSHFPRTPQPPRVAVVLWAMADPEAEAELPQDFAYDTKAFARVCPDHELPASFAPLHHSFAFESHKRSNLHYLDEVRAASPPLRRPRAATTSAAASSRRMCRVCRYHRRCAGCDGRLRRRWRRPLLRPAHEDDHLLAVARRQ